MASDQTDGIILIGLGALGVVGQMSFALIRHPILMGLNIATIGVGAASMAGVIELPEFMRLSKYLGFAKQSNYAGCSCGGY